MTHCTYHQRRCAQERRAATEARHDRAREIHLALAEAHAARANGDQILLLEPGVAQATWATVGHALRATPPLGTRVALA